MVPGKKTHQKAILAVLVAAFLLVQGCPNHPLLDTVKSINEEAAKPNVPVMVLKVATVEETSGTSCDIGSSSLGTAKEISCSIKNTGDVDLMLTGSPNKVAVSGTDAAEFTVTQPDSPITAGNAEDFKITFLPTSVTAKKCTLTIANNTATNPFTLDVTASCSSIAAPSALTATLSGSTTIHLTWTDNSDNETGFKVQRSLDQVTWTDAHTADANVTSWDDTGLALNTTYYYHVGSFNSTETTPAWSEVASAKTTDQPPAAPTGLTATMVSSSKIHLSWTDNSDCESGFKVEQSTDNLNWTVLPTLVAANTTTYDDTGLTPNATYYYMVMSTNINGDSAPSSSASATTASPPPAAPTTLSAVERPLMAVTLTWTSGSSNESGFHVERSGDGGGTWNLVGTVGPSSGSGSTVTDTISGSGLVQGAPYLYWVKAYNATDESVPSPTATAVAEDIPVVLITASPTSPVTLKMGDGDTVNNNTYPNVDQTINYSYYISKYLVTHGEFAEFLADNNAYTNDTYWSTNGNGLHWRGTKTQPTHWADAGFTGTDQPVAGVTYYEAIAYCNWRSTKEGLTPAYDANGVATLSATGYRLPTEVEWEYAAANGGSYTDTSLEGDYPWRDVFDAAKVVGSPASGGATKDVDSIPNGDTPQGLSDMAGNLYEWCNDAWVAGNSITSTTNRYSAPTDDSGTTQFVVRGGSYSDSTSSTPYVFRCAYRAYAYPTATLPKYGFRVVRGAP